jgi:arylformamidase
MKYIWLSHILNNETPLYGGERSIFFSIIKSIKQGDSCNTSRYVLTSHSGTHIDVPRHFFEIGRAIDEYNPIEWIYDNVDVVSVKADPGQCLGKHELNIESHVGEATELLLVKTGFEEHRKTAFYWQDNPALKPELAFYFREKCPNLRAVGIDFISVANLKHREQGRSCHKAFLENDILIIEDMSLSNLKKGWKLRQVIVSPLRVECSDGSPVTVIGLVDKCDN